MVTHHPKDKDGHPASPGWSPISLRLVTHYTIEPCMQPTAMSTLVYILISISIYNRIVA